MSSSVGLTKRRTGGSEPAAAGQPAAQSAPVVDDEANKGKPHALPPVAPSMDWIERHETWVPWLVLALAAFSRYYRLDKPTGVVFDEFHFGRFVGQYHMGTYLFDIHPPLGKLVLYYTSLLFGYDAGVCGYANIQDQYAPNCKYYVLRATAAFFGSITAPVLYNVLRRFGASPRGGMIAAMLFIMDGLNTSESRLVLIDSQLIFWCTCCLWVALAWWQRWNLHWAAVSEFEASTGYTPSLLFAAGPGGNAPAHLVPLSPAAAAAAVATLASERGEDAAAAVAAANALRAKDAKDVAAASASGKGASGKASAAAAASPAAPAPVPGRVAKAAAALATDPRVLGVWQRLLWVLAVAMSCANAVSIKFTGLATPGMIAVESFFALWFLRRSVPMLDLLAIAAVVIVAFIFYYFLHFGLLPNTGDGDAFMSVEFQRTLVNNTHYDPNAERPPFLKLVYDLNHEMVVASARIEQRHHWDSVWWEWIFNLRGILYYSREAGRSGPFTPPSAGHTYTETIYLLGNPLVIWMVLGGLVGVVALLLLYARYRTDRLMALPARTTRFVTAAIFCFLAYWLNLLPYLLVRRSSFIYHYMPALVYGEMMLALVVEQLAGKRWMHFATVLVVGAAAAGFLIYAPWIYAFPLTSEGHARRRWLSRWD